MFDSSNALQQIDSTIREIVRNHRTDVPSAVLDAQLTPLPPEMLKNKSTQEIESAHLSRISSPAILDALAIEAQNANSTNSEFARHVLHQVALNTAIDPTCRIDASVALYGIEDPLGKQILERMAHYSINSELADVAKNWLKKLEPKPIEKLSDTVLILGPGESFEIPAPTPVASEPPASTSQSLISKARLLLGSILS